MEEANKRVLVFDDDRDLLTIFQFLFQHHGWEVRTSETCSDVLAKTTEYGPDLILMDNWIPDTGGVVATQLLKNDSALKNIPVIYISANNDIKDIAAKAGADAHIAKPFDFDKLLELAHSLTNNNKTPD